MGPRFLPCLSGFFVPILVLTAMIWYSQVIRPVVLPRCPSRGSDPDARNGHAVANRACLPVPALGHIESVTRKHLANYLNEFEFRWNTRKLDDGQRVSRAIKQVQGKRLQYRESVDNPPYPAALPGQMNAPFEGV